MCIDDIFLEHLNWKNYESAFAPDPRFVLIIVFIIIEKKYSIELARSHDE